MFAATTIKLVLDKKTLDGATIITDKNIEEYVPHTPCQDFTDEEVKSLKELCLNGGESLTIADELKALSLSLVVNDDNTAEGN